MSADPSALPVLVRRAQAQPRGAAARTVAWRSAAVALCALLAMHFATIESVVGVWRRSDTFAHGFLIPPMAAWMIWRQRDRLSRLCVRPAPLALPALALLGALWLVSSVANVQVLQQYSVALMIAATVLAVLGAEVTRAIAYPLLFLLLAVPFGEVFIPPLIDFTARCTVLLLQLVGIPVFRENNFLSLPSGNWSVVEACSGLRYLIASLALGAMYAYITYRSPWRRWLFIAVSAIVPIIANAVRAFSIVLIGHWSNMTLAIGIDHLIYGWLFFGLVSALLFWVGARWRETGGNERNAATETAPPQRMRGAAATSGPANSAIPATPAGFARMALAVTALAALWPLIALLVSQPPADDGGPAPAPVPPLTIAAPPSPWRASPMTDRDWHALHMGRPQRWSVNYTDGSRTVSLQLTWYRHQTRHAELLAPVRRLSASGRPYWNEVSVASRTIEVGARRLEVRQSVEQLDNTKLLVWRWYRQGGLDTSRPQLLKLMLAKSKLLGGDDGGAEIVVASAYDDSGDSGAAERALHDLLLAMLPAIDRGLRDAAAH
jgi:exosortase A